MSVSKRDDGTMPPKRKLTLKIEKVSGTLNQVAAWLNGHPVIRTDGIVAAPAVAPETSLRLASPFTTGSELGHGPGLTYTLKGDPGDYLPGAKVGRLRAEWYFYWFPSGLKGGGRIGLAPFLDLRTHGTDKLHGVEYGAIVDLRLETTLLEY